MSNTLNMLLNVDSYKTSHFLQYPPGTEYVYSYIESRGSKFLWNLNYNRTLFFGLQAFLMEYLQKGFTRDDIAEAKMICDLHGVPFNEEGWERMYERYAGQFPIRVCALPEGSVVETGNALVTIVNTDPEFPWLTSYLETALLRAVWYPTTVASISWAIKQDLLAYAIRSGTPDSVDFRLHDFGARGVSSAESAAIGGMAHLINFRGTDTIGALLAARKYYAADMAGFSIPAAEHSTITSWGRDKEEDAYRNMLNKFALPGGIVAVVSDSYDIYKTIDTMWGGSLKQQIIDSGATVVIRPDSGDPEQVPITVIRQLMNKFGYTRNSKGFTVLPDYIRVIQGDGINHKSIRNILGLMNKESISMDNLSFGMGGALLQQLDRDTFKFAMKTSAIRVNGEWRDVWKDPIDDKGKISKKGRLRVEIDSDAEYVTRPVNDVRKANCLQMVFENGSLFNTTNLEKVRYRASAW